MRLGWRDLGGASWRLHDPISIECFEREGTELDNESLYVDMERWGTYLLALDTAE